MNTGVQNPSPLGGIGVVLKLHAALGITSGDVAAFVGGASQCDLAVSAAYAGGVQVPGPVDEDVSIKRGRRLAPLTRKPRLRAKAGNQSDLLRCSWDPGSLQEQGGGVDTLGSAPSQDYPTWSW